jgi:hypothetical protein
MYMWKNVHFLFWNEQKGDFKSAEGNGRPSNQVAWSEEKFVITPSPQRTKGLDS